MFCTCVAVEGTDNNTNFSFITLLLNSTPAGQWPTYSLLGADSRTQAQTDSPQILINDTLYTIIIYYRSQSVNTSAPYWSAHPDCPDRMSRLPRATKRAGNSHWQRARPRDNPGLNRLTGGDPSGATHVQKVCVCVPNVLYAYIRYVCSYKGVLYANEHVLNGYTMLCARPELGGGGGGWYLASYFINIPYWKYRRGLIIRINGIMSPIHLEAFAESVVSMFGLELATLYNKTRIIISSNIRK